MATEPAPPEQQGSGLSRKVGPFPLWVWVVGVGGVALYFYRRNAAASSTGAQLPGVTDTTTTSPGVDLTGQPLPGGTSGALSTADWANAVRAAFKGGTLGNFNAGLVEQSIYDFLAGNTLNAQESNVISTALQKVGYPSDVVPFYGTFPTHNTTPPPVVHQGSPAPKANALTPIAALQETQTAIGTLAGRYQVNLPTGSALAALVKRLYGSVSPNANLEAIHAQAAEVGYISSQAHLVNPSQAQITNQAAVIAQSHGQNFASLDSYTKNAYLQQANVALSEILNPVRAR